MLGVLFYCLFLISQADRVIMARLYGDKEFRILRTDLDKSLNCLFCVEVFMNFDEFLQDAKEIVDLEKWDHPRMCGNNDSSHSITSYLLGSPPHVREQLLNLPSFINLPGITPACAGTTLFTIYHYFTS